MVRLDFVEPEIAVVYLDREERGNSLTPDLLAALIGKLEQAEEKGARVGILRGSGERSFCTGYDLAELGQPLDPRSLRLEPAAQAFERARIPWLAYVNGRAHGGGFELLLACDQRIAAPHAVFRMPAVHLSIPYSPEGLRRFVRLIGPSKTFDLFATARQLTASQALDRGLIDAVGTFDSALAWARKVSTGGPLALEYTKAALHALHLGEDPANIPDLVRLRQTCLHSADLREGLEAVREGRAPDFKGR